MTADITYNYSVTFTGWGLAKYKNGEEYGFTKSKGTFTSMPRLKMMPAAMLVVPWIPQ